MKRLMIIFGFLIMTGTAFGACPDKYDELHMENMVLTGAGTSCPAGTVSYYEINDICTAHVK